MNDRSYALGLFMLATATLLRATTCISPPPCNRFDPKSIFFTGEVVDAGVPTEPGPNAARVVRLRVSEVFMGLEPTTKEVTLMVAGDWMRRGDTFLVDAYRDSTGTLSPALCGATANADSDDAKELLEYFNLRKAGKAKASIRIFVRDQYKPVADVTVQIAGPQSASRKTDAEGNALFESVRPGTYRIAANREHYKPDLDLISDADVQLLDGACPFASVNLRADGRVSGFLRDVSGAPIPSFALELNEIDSKNDRGWYSATTNLNGEFHFHSVSPGRHHLGTNLLGFEGTSPAPRTYYPGQLSLNGAIPIEVSLDHETGNLLYTLPDLGKWREIRIRAVNPEGQAIAGASIVSDPKDDPGVGAFDQMTRTDENGLAVVRGFERVRYRVKGTRRIATQDRLTLEISDSVDILPGNGAKEILLVLKRQNSFLFPLAIP